LYLDQKLETCLGIRMTPIYKGSLRNRLFIMRAVFGDGF